MMTLITIASVMMVAVAAPISTNDVYYYYNEYDVSVCAEPMVGIPCIGEMYFTDLPEFKYMYYYVWYKIDKKGVEIWYNYNNTEANNLGSVPCDKKEHSLVIDKDSFTSTLIDTGILKHFSFSFDITCTKKGNVIDSFNMNQTTYLKGNVLSTFPLVWFKDWEIIENEPTFNLEGFTTEPMPTPPPDMPCRYCGEKEKKEN
jgi:hypothetical protein